MPKFIHFGYNFEFSSFSSLLVTKLYERKQKENAAILQAELDCEMHTDAPQTVETVPLPPKELQQIHVEKAALDAIAQKRVNEEKIRTDFNASLAQQSIVLNQLMDNPVVEAKTPEVDEEIMSSSGSDSESDSEEKPWMIAGSFKQKFLPKQQKITDSETSKIFEISLLHNTSEMKWAVLMNLIKSVFKKIEVDCAIVGTKDHFLTNTKSRSVVKVISIRLKSDEDTSQLLATIQDAAPALNIDTPGAVLKAANAAEYSWRGLSAILGDSYGVMEIQQLLDSAAPTRFRITDFTVEATTDELTHLNISRDTCKTKILDNEGDLEDVDEFIFMKAVTLHGIETTVNAKALNLYEKFENFKFLIFSLEYFHFLNGFCILSRNAATTCETFSSILWEPNASAARNAAVAIILQRTARSRMLKSGRRQKLNGPKKPERQFQRSLSDSFKCNIKRENYSCDSSSVHDFLNKSDNYLKNFLNFKLFECNLYPGLHYSTVSHRFVSTITTTINQSVAHTHYYD